MFVQFKGHDSCPLFTVMCIYVYTQEHINIKLCKIKASQWYTYLYTYRTIWILTKNTWLFCSSHLVFNIEMTLQVHQNISSLGISHEQHIIWNVLSIYSQSCPLFTVSMSTYSGHIYKYKIKFKIKGCLCKYKEYTMWPRKIVICNIEMTWQVHQSIVSLVYGINHEQHIIWNAIYTQCFDHK